MAEIKTDRLEREYIIPLRAKWKHVARYKKTNRAVKAVKEFLVRHMKIRDRDLRKIKIDRYLNEFVWFRGIRNPPHKIKVKAIKDSDGIVRVELVDIPEKIKFLIESEAKKLATGKTQKAKEAEKKPEEVKDKGELAEEKKEHKEEDEKKKAVVEAGMKDAKIEAKQHKHQVSEKKMQKQPIMRKSAHQQ